MNEHFLSHDSAHIHYRWNRALKPVLTVRAGDGILVQCRDSSDGQATRQTTAAEWMQRDTDRIHALTGPIFVEGAMPGDVLEVEIRSIRHFGWGWSSIIPGMGFLSERFKDPYFFAWELEEHYSRSMATAVVPLEPFCGVMGVAPAEHGEFRTRAPGVFGGNMDVRQLTAGTTLYLPVEVPGALFSCGDAHAAQGDGEVCVTGIESPMHAVLRFELHKGRSIPGPQFHVPGALTPKTNSAGWYGTTGVGPDLFRNAQDAVHAMVDHISATYGLSPEDAYVLASLVVDLKISEIVDAGQYVVSALLPLNVFSARSP